jgi:hypothetical protein
MAYDIDSQYDSAPMVKMHSDYRKSHRNTFNYSGCVGSADWPAYQIGRLCGESTDGFSNLQEPDAESTVPVSAGSFATFGQDTLSYVDREFTMLVPTDYPFERPKRFVEIHDSTLHSNSLETDFVHQQPDLYQSWLGGVTKSYAIDFQTEPYCVGGGC